MSDLLSPILFLMENEVEAFWCFAGFMEKLVRSLHSQNVGGKYMYLFHDSALLSGILRLLNRPVSIFM